MNTYSKTIRTQISVLALLLLLAALAQAQDKPQKLDLNGLWNADTPVGVVKVKQTGSSVTGTFVSGGECPFGAPKITTYFEGQLRGFSQDGTASLDGTVYSCTFEKALYDCGFGNWSTPFHGIAREKTITITCKFEHYRDDRGDDSKLQDPKCPHHWVRDERGDKEITETLTRVCDVDKKTLCADLANAAQAAIRAASELLPAIKRSSRRSQIS